MLEALLVALSTVVSAQSLLYLGAGVGLGLIMGLLPGFGGTVGLALLLPFVYGMEPAQGLALMIGLMSVVATADTFPAVLIGIPGSVSSQATVVDGFPLAKQGQAARALSGAFIASLVGGVFGALVLTGLILIARPIVLAFGAGEMLMLAVLGLTMVGMLTGHSVLKGLLAGGLGLVLGMIGIAPATSEYRMDFDLLYLSNGIPLMVIALSIFAVPEIVDLLRRNSAIAEHAALGAGWWRGIKDAIRHRWLILRCSALGCLVGMLPGLGGSVVDWITYAHAVQSSKDKSRFGQGDIRGVLAPEASNNAKEGGALVPTLIFGIPGSAGTAILMGGMILLGVEPGITLISYQLDLVYTIIWSLAIANVIGAAACVALAKPVARLTTVDFTYLAPFLIMLIFFAAFQSSRAWGDLLAVVGIGTLAITMRRFGYPRPALMIGFVLAGGIETNLYQTVNFYGWSVFTRPLFLVLLLLCGLSAYAGYRMIRARRDPRQEQPLGRQTPAQWTFLGLMFIASAAPIVLCWSLAPLGRIFPLTVGALMLVASLLLAWRMARAPADGVNVNLYDDEIDSGRAPMLGQLAWFGLVLLASYLIGFYLAIGLFIALFVLVKTARPWRALIAAAAGLLVLAAMSYSLNLDFPRGLLQQWLGSALPWPLR